MSDKQEAKAEAGAAAAGAGGKKKKKLIIIVAVAVLLLGGGGGAAAWLLLGKKADKAHVAKKGAKGEAKGDEVAAEHDEEDADAEEEVVEEKPAKKAKEAVRKKKRKPFDPAKAPVFVELEPFTVNLADTPEPRMMQVKLTLEVKDAGSGEALKTLMPAMRNDILLLLGSRHAADMSSRDGKEKLGDEIVVAANDHLRGSKFARSVQGVHFQHLIIQ